MADIAVFVVLLLCLLIFFVPYHTALTWQRALAGIGAAILFVVTVANSAAKVVALIAGR